MFKNFCAIAYVILIGLKNDYNGVMLGPYLSRGDKAVKVTALQKIVLTPSTIRNLNLILY